MHRVQQSGSLMRVSFSGGMNGWAAGCKVHEAESIFAACSLAPRQTEHVCSLGASILAQRPTPVLNIRTDRHYTARRTSSGVAKNMGLSPSKTEVLPSLLPI